MSVHGGVRPRAILVATVYLTRKLLKDAGVIDQLEFGDGRSWHWESGVHYERLVDLETSEVTEFYHLELEMVKEQITREMGHKPVDHGLESFGCKLKSCPISGKSLRHRIAAHGHLVAFCQCCSCGFCLPQKGRSIHRL